MAEQLLVDRAIPTIQAREFASRGGDCTGRTPSGKTPTWTAALELELNHRQKSSFKWQS